MNRSMKAIVAIVVILVFIMPVSATFANFKEPINRNSMIVPKDIGSVMAQWPQEAKLTASDGSSGSYFGASVSIDGDYAIVGAFFASIKGAAYIFKRTGTNWAQEARLNASDGAYGDQFGNSVSISGDYAIVGAHTHNGNKGAAYIFKRTGTTWAQETELNAPDGASGDLFGFSVSIHNDTVLVGSEYDENSTGSAYVFTRSGSTWTQEAKLMASDGEAGDTFGISVSIQGNSAIIGARYDNAASGSAYVFTRTGTTWTEEAKLTASDGVAGDQFGNSVSISGNTVIVGEGGNTSNTGYAYFFARVGTAWTQEAKLTGSTSIIGDGLGWSVSIDGIFAIAGAPGGDGYNGCAFVFKHTGTTWTEEAKLTHSDPVPGDFLGYSVSIHGDTAVSGAFQKNNQMGAAYVFKKEAENQPPVADFFWTPQNPSQNQPITFDASASQDPDGTIISYEWDWDNDGIYDETQSSPTTTHIWTIAGSYPVTVRVTDDDDASSTVIKTVIVSEINLIIDISGGFGVKLKITNDGTVNVTDIPWMIHVEGGILGRINKTVNGTVNVSAGETLSVTTVDLFGLGPLTITAKVWDEEQTATGFQFIIFSMVKK